MMWLPSPYSACFGGQNGYRALLLMEYAWPAIRLGGGGCVVLSEGCCGFSGGRSAGIEVLVERGYIYKEDRNRVLVHGL